MIVIIPAYRAYDYIEECIACIPEKYDIIIGVDGCKKTLEVVKTIQRDKLEIFWSPVNSGCGVMRNTLIEYTDDDILSLDADDIYYPQLFEMIEATKENYDIIYWAYDEIRNGEIKEARTKHDFAFGVHYLSENAIDTLGGYMPWKCSMDTEMMARVKSTDLKTVVVRNPMMAYRYHDKNLTHTIPMEYRIKQRKKIKTKYEEDEIRINRVINSGEFIS